MQNRILKISISGLFIAISIILSRFFAGNIVLGGVSVLRLSFGQIPIFLAGLLLGPLYGGICGGMADFMGYYMNPMGPYFPGFTLSAALNGIIPGLLRKRNSGKWTWLSLLGVIAITEFITSISLNPLWLSILTGKAFIVYLPSTLISRAILVPIYTTVVKLLLKYSKKAIPSLQ